MSQTEKTFIITKSYLQTLVVIRNGLATNYGNPQKRVKWIDQLITDVKRCPAK